MFSAFSPHILSTKLSTEEFLLSLPPFHRPNEGPTEVMVKTTELNFCLNLINRMKKFKEYRSSGCLVILILNPNWAYLIDRTINFTTPSRANSVKLLITNTLESMWLVSFKHYLCN